MAWRSKAQGCVTLSSCEAEWHALSETVKEVIFVIHLLEAMFIKVEYPIKVMVDNIGSVFMSKNVTTSGRTKHVDARTKFVREFQENGVIKVQFVSSDQNVSDMFTKNVTSELLGRHSAKTVIDKCNKIFG